MAAPRPVEELTKGTFPLAGAEQRVLREWVAKWTFDIDEFSDLAQPLVRGDITSLERDYNSRVSQLHAQGVGLPESEQRAAQCYTRMRETRLKMPAMEVVIAGAQYHRRMASHSSHKPTDSAIHICSHKCADSVNRHGHPLSDHKGCLEFLHRIGVPVDSVDVAGFTAFMRASQTAHSRLDLARVLLGLGADVNHRSRFGGVALHEAIMAQDRIATAFLSRNGASMDIRDNDGVSPRDIVSLIL
ncbi:hypothetical protein IWW50_003586 [Coemansia erecta]|nr:hypothetical protein GGF43_003885 [Coemansia sp. RSA 2618]KAJ2823897.1 hypothetical protein IWW50_003586 [Coemansia erecta]